MDDYVVGIGEVLWDMFQDGKRLGGAPANFAYHISQFGLRGCVVSAIGNDSLGQEIITNLTSKGLNQHIETIPFPTGTVDVKINQAGIPDYDIKRDVAWDNIPYTTGLENLAHNTKAVCFGSLAQRNDVSRKTINKFLDAMPHGGNILKVFDVNFRKRFFCKEIVDESIKRCNVLKINDEELVILNQMFLIPGIDILDSCRFLIGKYNLKILILTCGTKGSYVFTPDMMSYLPTPEVEVVDTVGAGDSFTAAFVASILNDNPINVAHAVAVNVSAFVCTQCGATPVLPSELR